MDERIGFGLYQSSGDRVSLICLAVGFLTIGISLVYDFPHYFIFKSLSIIFWSVVCSFPTHIFTSS